MNELVSLLIFCQALGASVGAFTAVWGEFAYIRAMRDGKLDSAERAHLKVIANGLRFGMILILISSFGLVIVAYLLQTMLQPALSTSYWTLIVLALLIICVSWALSRRRVSFALGSATVFTAWWFIAYLAFGWFPVLSFGSAIAFFVIAVAIFYAILELVRFYVLNLHKK